MATMAALPKVGDVVTIDNWQKIFQMMNFPKGTAASKLLFPFVQMSVEKLELHALRAQHSFNRPKSFKSYEEFLALFATYPNKWRVVEYTDHITTTVHGTSQYRTFDLHNLEHEDDDQSYGLFGINETFLLPSHQHSLRSARGIPKGTMGTMGSMSMPYGDKVLAARFVRPALPPRQPRQVAQ